MLAIKRLIPNLLTAGNLVGGIMAIIAVTNGFYIAAPLYIAISLVLDFLDGFVARLLNVQSELGKQLDSLADMVTFGAVPGILMFYFLFQVDNDQNFFHYFDITTDQVSFNRHILEVIPIFLYAKWYHFIAILLPICALFRLAKFNIDTRQLDSFIGLPTPAMTLFFLSYPLIYYFEWDSIENPSLLFEFFFNKFTIYTFIIVMSLLMVSEIPLFSLKFKHFKLKGNEIRFIFLTICILLLATLFLWAIPLIIILYIILSLINNAIKPKHEV